MTLPVRVQDQATSDCPHSLSHVHTWYHSLAGIGSLDPDNEMDSQMYSLIPHTDIGNVYVSIHSTQVYIKHVYVYVLLTTSCNV